MAAEVSGKITLAFDWQGSSHLENRTIVQAVNLVFQNATTTISVMIPIISYRKTQELPFKCKKIDGRETYPERLSVTIEQIRNLSVQARVVGRDNNTKILHIPLDLPRWIDPVKTYHLVVSSENELYAELINEDLLKENSEEENANVLKEPPAWVEEMKAWGNVLAQQSMNRLATLHKDNSFSEYTQEELLDFFLK